MVYASKELLKKIKKLSDKKYRDIYGLFAVEGERNAIDSIIARKNDLECVLISEDKYGSFDCDLSDIKVFCVRNTDFDKLADTVTSQGIIAVFKLFKPSLPISEHCILLERVRDPGNLGTIIRTACAAGYDIVLNNCADLFAPKTVRSCMSALTRVNFSYFESVDALKLLGYKICVCDMKGVNVFESNLNNGKICLVVGNEANGVSSQIVESADKIISLPQSNEIESLNVAVAAGIIMYVVKYVV